MASRLSSGYIFVRLPGLFSRGHIINYLHVSSCMRVCARVHPRMIRHARLRVFEVRGTRIAYESRGFNNAHGFSAPIQIGEKPMIILLCRRRIDGRMITYCAIMVD